MSNGTGLKFQKLTVNFELRSPWFGLGRTVLAVGQLTLLIFTPTSALMVQVLGRPSAPYCDGVKVASLYCSLGSVTGIEVVRWVMVAVLLVVAIGWRPRWSVLPHAWVAFSINQSIALPDGGDSVAQIMTLLILAGGLLDDRKWHWSWPTEPVSPSARGYGFAIWTLLRLQLAGIYLNSGIAKFGTESWVAGSAEYFVARDKSFGASGIIAPVLLWITGEPWGAAALTWGPIVIECAIAFFIFGGPRMRLLALSGAIVLHAGIIVTMGLWSFGLIMIGTVIVATNLSYRDTLLLVCRPIQARGRRRSGESLDRATTAELWR